MNKSIIIIIGIVWLFCAAYLSLAKLYDYPYAGYAMAGSWIASLLLLASIVIFIRKNRKQA